MENVQENTETKKEYEEPVFEIEDGMQFTEETMEEFNGGNWCFGCTNCSCN